MPKVFSTKIAILVIVAAFACGYGIAVWAFPRIEMVEKIVEKEKIVEVKCPQADPIADKSLACKTPAVADQIDPVPRKITVVVEQNAVEEEYVPIQRKITCYLPHSQTKTYEKIIDDVEFESDWTMIRTAPTGTLDYDLEDNIMIHNTTGSWCTIIPVTKSTPAKKV